MIESVAWYQLQNPQTAKSHKLNIFSQKQGTK